MKPTPKMDSRGFATPRHLRSPAFKEYLRKAAQKGGKSRSLRKLDASRRNGRLGGGAVKRGPNLGQRVPPINAVECIAGEGAGSRCC
jgi:hypothetical protein